MALFKNGPLNHRFTQMIRSIRKFIKKQNVVAVSEIAPIPLNRAVFEETDICSGV